MKKANLPAPILLTGCARSGTSMTAGIIANSGAFGGEMSGPNRHNRKGMFENSMIREQVIKPYLIANGCDPKGQFPLPDTLDLKPFEDLGHIMEGIMLAEGYEDGPWFYKGAKMCLIWPVIRDAFPDAKWVIVRRDDQDIVNSCLKTAFMNAHKQEDGWFKWIEHHKNCFEEMIHAGLDIMEVWPSKFINGDFSEIETVVNQLGLQYSQEFAENFVDKKLWKGGS